MRTYVSTLQAQTSLKERQDLIEVTLALIDLHDGRQFLGVDDDVETANLRLEQCKYTILPQNEHTYQSELALLQACGVDLLPNPVKTV